MVSEVYNMDCVEFMKHYPDKFFDLAVVDPPYGIGASNYERGGTQHGNSAAVCKTYTKKDWDNEPPSLEYFYELFRVSKNQIVWGANHFISRMPYDSSCWIIWDKMTAPGSGYADCEMAWTSFKTAVRQAKIRWSGMLQHDMKNKEERVHPTQKPVKLYDWIFNKYAEKGQRILDTHLGGGSIRLAAHKNGLDFYGAEIDKEYFDISCKRYDEFIKQGTLFQTPPSSGEGSVGKKTNTLFDAA